jgi:hypothetical protein
MLQWAVRILCFLAVTLSTSMALTQSDFSAEMWDRPKLGIPNATVAPTVSKVYLTKDKMRAEAQSGSTRDGGTIIIDFATQTRFVLMAQRHMYTQTPAQSQSQRLGYTLFHAQDAETACRDWEKLEHNQGGSCRKVADESVHGRKAVKYETTNSSGDISRFWIDPKLDFPLKWESKSSEGELSNIKEGTQPANLFEIPAGFTKVDLQPH